MSKIFRWGAARRPLFPLLLLLLLGGCTSSNVATGIVNDRLMPCPESPNCVSSDATDDDHRVAPYRLAADPQSAWEGLKDVIGAEERVTLVTEDDRYLHIEVRSAVFRFVDDTEFHLRPSDGIIAVRSAARVGYSDLGVNRKRVEKFRESLRSRGLVD